MDSRSSSSSDDHDSDANTHHTLLVSSTTSSHNSLPPPTTSARSQLSFSRPSTLSASQFYNSNAYIRSTDRGPSTYSHPTSSTVITKRASQVIRPVVGQTRNPLFTDSARPVGTSRLPPSDLPAHPLISHAELSPRDAPRDALRDDASSDVAPPSLPQTDNAVRLTDTTPALPSDVAPSPSDGAVVPCNTVESTAVREPVVGISQPAEPSVPPVVAAGSLDTHTVVPLSVGGGGLSIVKPGKMLSVEKAAAVTVLPPPSIEPQPSSRLEQPAVTSVTSEALRREGLAVPEGPTTGACWSAASLDLSLASLRLREASLPPNYSHVHPLHQHRQPQMEAARLPSAQGDELTPLQQWDAKYGHLSSMWSSSRAPHRLLLSPLAAKATRQVPLPRGSVLRNGFASLPPNFDHQIESSPMQGGKLMGGPMQGTSVASGAAVKLETSEAPGMRRSSTLKSDKSRSKRSRPIPASSSHGNLPRLLSSALDNAGLSTAGMSHAGRSSAVLSTAALSTARLSVKPEPELLQVFSRQGSPVLSRLDTLAPPVLEAGSSRLTGGGFAMRKNSRRLCGC